MKSININVLKKEQFDSFFNYLTIHLAENGNNGIFFLPLTKEQSSFGAEWKEKFISGFDKEFGTIGWRKIWVATNQNQQIVGHIDIRTRPELNTSHRVLLGMGVDCQFRKLKIGQQLLTYVIDYCKNDPRISWLDLDVLATNTFAIRLYEKMKFQTVNNTIDMFRIDNISYSYISMTLNVDTESSTLVK